MSSKRCPSIVLVLERIISVIGPVFLIIAIGYGYGRRNRPDLRTFNHVSLHVLGPLLVFTSLAGEDFQLQGNAAFIAGGVVVILVSGLIAWPVARLARISPRTFVPPMMFNNCANMGLPLAVLTFVPAGQFAELLLFASLPAAGLNYLLGERYQQEPERVASLVLIGNAFAIVFVPLGLTLGLHPI